MLESGKDAMELHDIVAVWCAIENPPVDDEGIDRMPKLEKGWKATKRVFDIERYGLSFSPACHSYISLYSTGEITRGMLVVDKRDSQNTCAPGTNYAEVQVGPERHLDSPLSAAVPTQVDVEHPADPQIKGQGVACVVETPGSEKLLKMMLERVWGVQVSNTK